MPTSNPTSFDFLSSAVTLLDGLQYIGTAFKLVKNYHDSDQRRKHVIPWLVERAIQPMELSPLDRKFVLEQLRKPSFLDELHKARLPDHVRNAVDKVEVTKNTLENVAKSIENAMVQLWKSEGSPQEAVLIEASQRIEAEIKNFNEIVQEAFEKFQRPESPQELVRRAIPAFHYAEPVAKASRRGNAN